MDIVSVAGREWNEDFAYSNKNFSFVIDGATSITNQKFSNEETDAKWFSNNFGEYLKKHLNDKTLSIAEIVKKGIKYINKKYKLLAGDTKVLDMPSACISIVRKNQDKMEYFMLGDCGLLFKHKNKIKEYVDTTLIKLDKINIKKMIKISKEKHITVLEARKLINDDVLKIRLLKNTAKGYWTLCDSTEACDHAKVGEIKCQPNDEFLLFSDGFSQVWNVLHIFNKKQVFKYLENHTLSNLVNLLHSKQNEDAGCNKFPRMKTHDDTSAVYFKI